MRVLSPGADGITEAWWDSLEDPQAAVSSPEGAGAMRMPARAVDLIFASAGTTAIRNAAAFQKHFRDVHTMTQHAFGSASRFESAGQLMLGGDTDWPFFAL
jgi:Acyl-CoA dehydrogenase, C-terminal domain